MIKIEEKTYLDWTATVVVKWVKFYLLIFYDILVYGSFVCCLIFPKPYISHEIGIESGAIDNGKM